MAESEGKVFAFLEKYLMGPMGKVASWRFVRAIMAAGMAAIPFVIVGSMFLVFNILPETFPFLQSFFLTIRSLDLKLCICWQIKQQLVC